MTPDEAYVAAIADAIRLGLMTDWGKATDACQCSECEGVFSTEGNFDRHRRGGSCLSPETCGLVRGPKGVWRQPGPVDGSHDFRRGQNQDSGEAAA
jgi:hypothetical protein